MDLQIYDERHVRVTDIYGATHTGVADYYNVDYCLHEYGDTARKMRLPSTGISVQTRQCINIPAGIPTLHLRWHRKR